MNPTDVRHQSSAVRLIECPRDAMQGIHDFIPTEKKIAYINSILKCGFDTVDFGSFVSPKAIPQMRDTAEVLQGLDLPSRSVPQSRNSPPFGELEGAVGSRLLAIVANTRGAEDAVAFDEITYLGFPFSISETFQQRNTNSSLAESLKRVEEIQSLCQKKSKQLVIYISMAFGNPYGDEWNIGKVEQWVKKLSGLGIKIFALSDTIGVSNPENINYLFSSLIPSFPQLEIGAHLHTTPATWEEKVDAAYHAGCRRFDSAIKGYGGCPMATDKLTGNMPTENLLSYFNKKEISTGVHSNGLLDAMRMAMSVFPK
ncbi:MAG: hydroxymethylglutaryl-CoA lyase [Bacteroidetes bacterium]|nr:MAG: hydroxymethylglutaryl-CoA lyase [Bacteroidota bacterium]